MLCVCCGACKCQQPWHCTWLFQASNKLWTSVTGTPLNLLLWKDKRFCFLLGMQWFGIFWQRFGSMVNYVVWQWAPIFIWQPNGRDDIAASLCSGTSILRVSTVTFLPIAIKPSIDLELEYIYRKSMKHRFHRLSVRKYCQLFTHESNTFLLQNMLLKPVGQWGKQPQNPPFLLEARESPSKTWMPGVTPLTMPNYSLIGSCTSAQLHRVRKKMGPIMFRYNFGKYKHIVVILA